MHRTLRDLLLVFILAGTSVLAAPAGGHAALSWRLELQLPVGERVWERVDERDSVQWKLPEHRLEKFRKAGVIITELHLDTTTITALVTSRTGEVAVLQGASTVTSLDVPRHTVQSSTQLFTAALLPDNAPAAAGKIELENAAMAALPTREVTVGSRWSTRLSVMTNLGSGQAIFEHLVTGFSNGRIEISVHGSGTITGTQYHLPKLLPGTIQLDGAAWYDPAAHMVVAESYTIRNRIIKPMEGEESGFDERLTVDTSTHVTSSQ